MHAKPARRGGQGVRTHNQSEETRARHVVTERGLAPRPPRHDEALRRGSGRGGSGEAPRGGRGGRPDQRFHRRCRQRCRRHRCVNPARCTRAAHLQAGHGRARLCACHATRRAVRRAAPMAAHPSPGHAPRAHCPLLSRRSTAHSLPHPTPWQRCRRPRLPALPRRPCRRTTLLSTLRAARLPPTPPRRPSRPRRWPRRPRCRRRLRCL